MREISFFGLFTMTITTIFKIKKGRTGYAYSVRPKINFLKLFNSTKL